VTTTARIVASVGGSLQIVGVALVFWEIWASQRALNKRTWTRAIVEALSSPFRRLWQKVRGSKGSVVALEASVTATATLDARVTILEPDDAPIERRIEIHRQRLDLIDRQLDEIRAEAAKLRTDLGDRLNSAVGEAIEQTKRLREVVDQLGVGSVGLRALGGVLVLVGSALWIVSEWL
jgi:regulator of extracellular matrix RemA (YlzA/DUF370 family)